MSDGWLTAAAWLGTYLVHSTLVLGAAALVTRFAALGVRLRDGLWKVALVLPLVTASLQVALPHRTLSPRLQLAGHAEHLAEHPRRDAGSARQDVHRAVDSPTFGPFAVEPARLALELPLAASDSASAPATGRMSVPPAVAGERLGVADRRTAARRLAAPLAFALAVALIILVAWPSLRLARLLRRRTELRSGALHEALGELRARSGMRRRVRLTVSGRVGSPVALGVLRPEICVPPRAVSELSRPLARALIAHELAHHARLDPLWTRLVHVVTVALAVQPLNRLARRELVGCAELLADDLAVEWTSDRVSLARCLTEVAGWLRPAAPAVAAVAMVRRSAPSALRRRVERVLEQPRERAPRVTGLLALVAGALIALVAPGVAREVPPGTSATPSGAMPATLRLPSPFDGALDRAHAELAALATELELLDDHPDRAVRSRARALLGRAASLERHADDLALEIRSRAER